MQKQQVQKAAIAKPTPSSEIPTRSFSPPKPTSSEVQPRSGYNLLDKPLFPIQAKLTIGEPNDQYEQEADRVAKQVVHRLHAPQSSQAKLLQPKKLDKKELRLKPIVQRQSEASSVTADPEVENAIRRSRNSGQALTASIRKPMEQAFGSDFSGVRVHTNTQSDQLNHSLQAKAFTTGKDIFFRQGAYAPQNRSGQELLAHELTHVVQQNGGAVQRLEQDETAVLSTNDIQALATSEKAVQRKFGFEIEVPIFFSYTDPTAADQTARFDAMQGSGGGAVFHPSPNFEIKVDHNQELLPLAAYEEQVVPLPHNRFSDGPSIIELVTTAWDEQTLSAKDVKDRVKEMVTWVKAKKKQVGKGQIAEGGGYYLGSDSKDAKTLQTTDGYVQSTYGIKLSRVPKLVEKTTSVNPDVTDHEALRQASDAAEKVMSSIRIADSQWNDVIALGDSKSLEGYILLLANYLIAGGRQGPMVGLGKNAIGQYFYKTDMGKLAGALPPSVTNRLYDQSNGSIDSLFLSLFAATKRQRTDRILKGVGPTCEDWVWDVLIGQKDTLLAGLMNPYSQELGPDTLGSVTSQESAVVMENREIQYLDPNFQKKQKQQDKEKQKFFSSKKAKDPMELKKFLAQMTDPKKFPIGKWEDIILRVYAMVKELNS